MLKPKLPLQAFSASIAQSVARANEMLQLNHKAAIQRYKKDRSGAIMPPPPPLMIHNVRVKFKGNISKNEQSGELFLDLSRPDGNFAAEMDFVSFSDEMLKAAKYDGSASNPFEAGTANRTPTPAMTYQSPEQAVSHPMPLGQTIGQDSPQEVEQKPYNLELDDANSGPAYDMSNTSRCFDSEF